MAVGVRQPIRPLPPRAAERIAAGEVIERPASVVKELVENALDAGATSIRVEVRGGGLRLVRVVDDGCGIPADEIPLAFQRHATSKIRGVEDLAQLATLGFRGEALASIAAVAEVDLLTAADSSGLGTEATVRGGSIVACVPRPRQRGTTVTVRYLFQNVPARLKFVANARGELAAITAVVQRYALAYPEVRFTLLIEGRQTLRTSGRRLAATLPEVFGAAVAEALYALPPLTVGEAHLTGYLSARHVTRPNRGGIVLLVNRRWVEARALLQALEAAYRPLLPRGRHPIAVLSCALPPHAVDVNVHPAKTEVKLLHGAELAEALGRWVREALGRSAAQPAADLELGLSLLTREGTLRYALSPPAARRVAETPPSPPGRERRPAAGERGERGESSLPPLRLVSQVQAALLLCEGPAGLYLIDQHRAHERVLYERLRARHGPAAATEIEPVVLELRPADAARLASRLSQLAALGFQCEWFGGRSFLVRAAPTLPGAAAGLAPALADVLADVAAEEDDWQDRLLISIACHSALRRGVALTWEAMEALLAELDTVAAPAVCPHGSPLILHLSEPFLARQFRWR
ncbi:MAG TPA: DNA mismatch repair endonuclease MutL [Chloroflexota bacterium]|nr:DNA mismatch repair endonuclease MutL [Chloroflexota bacterium]